MNNFRSREVVIYLDGATTTLEKCKEEARQLSIAEKRTVVFLFNGRMYMWCKDDEAGPRLEEMN